MGEVYRARDTRLDRDVALKLIHPQLAADADRIRRFEQEARAAARLDHPNILVVHDVGTQDGTPYIVSELLDGDSLRELVRSPLSPRTAVDLGLQVARGLSAAHEKGIVHRDLKPENVFVRKDGQVKLLDFGIAKLTQPVSVDGSGSQVKTVSATETGTLLGTVGYMSPEQVQGNPVDARSDLFSLGVVLYEMLSGKAPFRRATAPETLTAILREEPLDLSETNKNVPPALERIVRRCLAKDATRRFQSAREVVSGLEALVGTLDARPATPMSAVGVFLRRHAIGLAISTLLVLAALGSGFWWKSRTASASSLRRLAVLPFENLSGDPGQEYLSDGLTQEIIAQLGRLHPASLSVIARTSVMRYKKSDKPVDQIGRELNVDYVLEGSARREGARVRITAQLIQVKGQSQLWSDTFERDLSGILALQSDVAQKVAGALALKLLPAERSRIANTRAVNPDAYEAYLKGLHHVYKVTAADMEAAQSYFETALAKDPDYALAHAGVALLWMVRSQMGYASPSEAAPKARAEALKAIELDDSVAETHYALGVLRTWTEWDWGAAEKEFRRAIELNPSFPDARSAYSHLLMILGRPDEAMREIRRALELDPFNSIFRTFNAGDLFYARRYDDAIAEVRIALRTGPGDPAANNVLWIASARRGIYDEALTAAKTCYKLYGDRRVDEAFERGEKEGGYRGAMKRAAEALIVLFRESYANPTDIAWLMVEAGDSSRAIEWLEKGYEVRDPVMPYIGWPLSDPLRSDPRFQALLRKMNLPAN